jgi:hypothetical protein
VSVRNKVESIARARAEICTFAKRFLSGEIGVIETARGLSPFWDLFIGDALEPHVRVFVGINSDTDALSVGDVRQYWASDALDQKHKEIAGAEEKWRDRGRVAAEAIVQLLKDE